MVLDLSQKTIEFLFFVPPHKFRDNNDCLGTFGRRFLFIVRFLVDRVLRVDANWVQDKM